MGCCFRVRAAPFPRALLVRSIVRRACLPVDRDSRIRICSSLDCRFLLRMESRSRTARLVSFFPWARCGMAFRLERKLAFHSRHRQQNLKGLSLQFCARLCQHRDNARQCTTHFKMGKNQVQGQKFCRTFEPHAEQRLSLQIRFCTHPKT